MATIKEYIHFARYLVTILNVLLLLLLLLEVVQQSIDENITGTVAGC